MPANNNLHVMYMALLTENSQHTVSPQMQQVIYDYAVGTKDTTLLTKLTSYSGLTFDMDVKLSKRNELDVLVAWACRKNRTTAELEKRLLREKRVSALLPLASRPGLEQAVYSTIARISSVHLCEALAKNSSVDENLRKTKIVEFAKNVPRGAYGPHASKLKSMIENETSQQTYSTFYEAVARTSNVAPYLTACLTTGLVSSEAITIILDKLSIIFTITSDRFANQGGDFVSALASQPLTQDQRLKLKTALEAYVGSRSNSWYMRQYTEALDKLKNHDASYETTFKEFVGSTDQKSAAHMLSMLKLALESASSNSTDRQNALSRLAQAVSMHKYLAPVAMLEYVHLMSRSDVEHLVLRLEKDKEEQTLLDVVDRANDKNATVSALRNEESIVRAYIKRLDSTNAAKPVWLSYTKTVNNDHELAYNTLAYANLLSRLKNYSKLNALIEFKMLETLGSNPDRWSAFNVLAADYEGTLPQLLETVNALV